MKKWESFLQTKKGKIQAWILIALVAVLAVVLIFGIKLIQKRNNELEDNQIEAGVKVETPIEETSGEDEVLQVIDGFNVKDALPGSLYRDLSGDKYSINSNTNTITFDEDLTISRFTLSDNPEGPTENDIWHDVSGEKEIEILDTEIKKKYVYYKAYGGKPNCLYTGMVVVSSTNTAIFRKTKDNIYLSMQINSGGTPAFCRVAVWGTVGGQDDLVWYELTNNGSNSWGRAINIAAHDNSTYYSLHFYAFDSYSNPYFICNYDYVYDTTAPAGTIKTPGPLYTTTGKVTVKVDVWDRT